MKMKVHNFRTQKNAKGSYRHCMAPGVSLISSHCRRNFLTAQTAVSSLDFKLQPGLALQPSAPITTVLVK